MTARRAASRAAKAASLGISVGELKRRNKAEHARRVEEAEKARRRGADFRVEMQPLAFVVATREQAIAAIPSVLDIVLRHSDGALDADLLDEAVAELTAFFPPVDVDAGDEADAYDCGPASPYRFFNEHAAFVEACNAVFDEFKGLMRAEMLRRGIAA